MTTIQLLGILVFCGILESLARCLYALRAQPDQRVMHQRRAVLWVATTLLCASLWVLVALHTGGLLALRITWWISRGELALTTASLTRLVYAVGRTFWARQAVPTGLHEVDTTSSNNRRRTFRNILLIGSNRLDKKAGGY